MAGDLDSWAVFNVPPHASVRTYLEDYQSDLERDFGKGVELIQRDATHYDICVDKVQYFK